MKRTDQERLLKEIFDAEGESGFRRDSLNRGLKLIRRRKILRRCVVLCVLPSLLVLAIWRYSPPHLASVASIKTQPAITSFRVGQDSQRSKVDFISDEQLFELFPNRSLALVGRPGHQKLVFLDGFEAKARQKL
ncbi:MAG: hypothetical protein JWM99_2884 [Verrucomicrobiales bacterium]|nr:hypothetical protein [Verrucomicrobiales bacterium]